MTHTEWRGKEEENPIRKAVKKLFKTRNPYDREKNDPLFLRSIKETTKDLMQENEAYHTLCKAACFTPDSLLNEQELPKIPVLPTLFLKRNDISTKRKALVEVTSSGTSGTVSRVNYTFGELKLLGSTAFRLGKKHGIISLKPTRYLILGYQPARKNQAVISKTAFLSTFYAPGISRTYALSYKNGTYHLDLNVIIKKLLKFSKRKLPVRLIGFPSYTYFLLEQMKKEGKLCQLPKGSKLLLGGGWKQFSDKEVSKESLYELVKEVLGVEEKDIHEFFGAAEHPILYCSCKNHHFHIPAYGKVFIRDVATMEVLPKGEVGLMNFLTPIKSSLPLVSVMTDDLGVLREGSTCGCGIQTDYFELLGRVGVEGVKTCSAGAGEYLKG